MGTTQSLLEGKVYIKENYQVPEPRPRSNSEEILNFEGEEDEPAQIIHVEPLTLKDNKLFSTLHGNCTDHSSPALMGLFLSLHNLDYQRVFGRSTFSPDFIDVYPALSPVDSDLNSKDFDMLSAWYLGCHISDYIILAIDYKLTPELHHSDLLFKFFCLLKEIEKPLYILHDCENYAYSFQRTSELIEQALANDRVLLHEEISLNVGKNA